MSRTRGHDEPHMASRLPGGPLGLPFNRREVEWALKDEGLMRDEMGEVENRWLLDEAGAVVQLSRKLH